MISVKLYVGALQITLELRSRQYEPVSAVQHGVEGPDPAGLCLMDEFVRYGSLNHFEKLKVFLFGQAEIPTLNLLPRWELPKVGLKSGFTVFANAVETSSCERSRRP
jgi:hypothetical protein